MAKVRNIEEVQNRIIGQFKRDARSGNENSAVAQAIRAGKKTKKIVDDQPDFVPGSPAHLAWIESKKK